MDAYRAALQAYLATSSQRALADSADTSQANISRYLAGERFPSREIAERIDAATGGSVPFAIWQIVMAERVGITGQAA
jgi:transcriptional regulator with XRE-family HTH domain